MDTSTTNKIISNDKINIIDLRGGGGGVGDCSQQPPVIFQIAIFFAKKSNIGQNHLIFGQVLEKWGKRPQPPAPSKRNWSHTPMMNIITNTRILGCWIGIISPGH